jgi:hypothetical protein
MRIAAIACAAVIGLASGSAVAACNWTTAKADDVVASATTPTQAPAQSTPVKLPESDQQG